MFLSFSSPCIHQMHTIGDFPDDQSAAQFLHEQGIHHLDVSPGEYEKDPTIYDLYRKEYGFSFNSLIAGSAVTSIDPEVRKLAAMMVVCPETNVNCNVRCRTAESCRFI